MKLFKNPSIHLAFAAMLWSIGGLFIKIVSLDSLAIAGLRSGIAFLVIALYQNPFKLKFTKKHLTSIMVYSLTLVCFVTANKLTTSANAIFLQFTAPIWVLVLSKILKIKVHKEDYLIVGIILMGMFCFFFGDLTLKHTLGNMIAIVCGMCFAGLIFLLKGNNRYESVAIVTYGNLLVFLIAIPSFFDMTITTPEVLSLLTLGIFQIAIPYIIYVNTLPRVSPVEAVTIPIIEPLFNPIWVMVFTRERPSIYTLIGGFFILSTLILKSHLTSKQTRLVDKEKNAA